VTLREDPEIFVTDDQGKTELRVTREIQPDVLPRFLSPDRLLAAIGEPRHRRSYVYDLTDLSRRRLFHNNTVRTIAPEYAWTPSADGTRILIQAERDGDTISPERGIYLVDLRQRVSRDELLGRLRQNLAAEQALRGLGHRIFQPIAADVQRVLERASVARIFAYEKALFAFDSKHISRPGNRLAADYLHRTYASFGYQPEYQWFDARAAVDGRTANVVARLAGTVNPDVIYVASSHFDSVAAGPGADDDSSGTAALLEAARILADRPLPATIVFASFTGEEAGLLGSREFVRRAQEAKLRVAGVVNNDMVGWTNDHRLDDTIRYSSPGIRDVQHAAAFLFTKLITYDAVYFKSTDAASFYEAYGDIVGGIGSYPVLGNPHYHTAHDVLDTINHQLVTEVSKATVATLMLLASSPSRVTGLTAARDGDGTVRASWNANPERDVVSYIVAYGPASDPGRARTTVTSPRAVLRGLGPDWTVSVQAVDRRGLHGWDWARASAGT
jgi:hypothetical protein